MPPPTFTLSFSFFSLLTFIPLPATKHFRCFSYFKNKNKNINKKHQMLSIISCLLARKNPANTKYLLWIRYYVFKKDRRIFHCQWIFLESLRTTVYDLCLCRSRNKSMCISRIKVRDWCVNFPSPLIILPPIGPNGLASSPRAE